MKIAVGIPTINRFDLLKESLNDLSKNFGELEHLYVVDNGKQGLTKNHIPENIREKTWLHIPEINLGVAKSWNWMLNQAFNEDKADYLLILNDDIVLGKTKEYLEKLIADKGDPHFLGGSYFWSVFMVSKDCYKEIGSFDEQFSPAYFEDNDYAHRMVLKSRPDLYKFQLPELDPSVKRNSMSIKKDPNLNKAFGKNKDLYVKKWGGVPLQEKFWTPYNT